MDCCHNCFACFGFFPLCVETHAHCHRLCLTQYVELGGKSRSLQWLWRLAHAFRFIGQLALILR